MKKILLLGLGICANFMVFSQCQNAGFSGLNTTYSCPETSFLTGYPTGGIFAGPGMTNNIFDPVAAGVGSHVISYTTAPSTPTAGYTVTEGQANTPYSGSFTPVALGDDEVSTLLPIGFTFNFFGADYTDFLISSNGFITFDQTSLNSGCCSGQFVPEAFDPNNLIALAWNDLNPSNGGTIGYTTIGSAPNRILIVDYAAVQHFGSAGTPITVQAKLYEGTNVIEIHSTQNASDGSEQTLGIENSTGTCGFAGMNTNMNMTFSVLNGMISFAPAAAAYYSHITGLTNAPYVGPLTPFTLTDNQLTNPMPIGFNFDFYGTNYSDFRVSSNGFITFDQLTTADGCCSGQMLPDLAVPNNLIGFAWNDLNSDFGGTMGYTTIGTAPNRILIMSFDAVAHNVGSGIPITTQVKLYETSNIIEIHSTQNQADGSAQTMGLENLTGTEANTPIDRNSNTAFSVVNEMTLFYPYYTAIHVADVTSATDIEAPVPEMLTLADIVSECEVTEIFDQYANDNCSGFILGTHDAIFPITSNTTVTWSYDDGNGNVGTQTQLVLVNDATAPIVGGFIIEIINGAGLMDEATWTFTDGFGTVVASGGPYFNGSSIGDVEETVNISGTNGPYTFYGTTVGSWNDNVMDFTISCSGTLLNSGTVTAGSTSTASNIENCDPMGIIESQCGAVWSLDQVVGSDNCAGPINGINDAVFPITSSTDVTWTFDDGNGNISTYIQQVIISEDLTAPTPNVAILPDIISYCEVTTIATPTATDNCGATAMGFAMYTLPITAPMTLSWLYDDGNGNQVNQDQNIVFVSIAPILSVSGATISVTNTAPGSTYQWMDCDNGNSPITNATTSSYLATENGNYAVAVTNGSCTETSACNAIDLTSLSENDLQFLNVYPNPATDVLFIETTKQGNLEIHDLSGKLIFKDFIENSKNEISVAQLATGTYTVRFISETAVKTVRLVISK